MITKALLLFLAATGSAGFLYRSQLQSLLVQALRQPASSQSVVQPLAEAAPPADSARLAAGQFHATVLDEPRIRTNQWENTVSTAGGPIVYGTEVVKRVQVVTPLLEAPRRIIVQQPARQQPVYQPHPVIRRNGN